MIALIISWLAALSTIVGTILAANKMKSSWTLYIIGGILWIVYATVTKQYALLTVNFILIGSSLYGLYKWTK